jgi:acetate kinase
VWVLVVNAGSSSLKLALVGPDDSVAAATEIETGGGPPVAGTPFGHGAGTPFGHGAGALRDFLAGLDRVDAVGHRVVHGGDRFAGPVVVDDGVMVAVETLAPLAPLHQPRAITGLRAVAELLPDVPSVACFDTAFHATLPPAAATYALPRSWRERWGLRRFGFHGLSHAWAVVRAAELLGRTGDPRHRVVSCHLGAGSSLCAAVGGRSVDTTMGFTPTEGLVMATRSGSVDPGLVAWLVTDAGLDPGALARGLTHEAGLAGLAGGGGDMRDVLTRADAGDPSASLARDVWVHRLRREIAAMAAAAGGLDALVFTGGIGQHQARLRAAAVDDLGFLGVAVDPAANAAAPADGDTDVSAQGAAVHTLVVAAREDIQIAREVRSVLG